MSVTTGEAGIEPVVATEAAISDHQAGVPQGASAFRAIIEWKAMFLPDREGGLTSWPVAI